MAENHKTAEPDDPLELVGMVVPVPPGYDSMAEMGRCFVEEFAFMGWDRRRILRELFGAGGDDVWMQPPFFCDYGFNILLGRKCFFNFNCVVLDVSTVRVGDYTLFGPAVQIYTATHPMEAELRRTQEFARPIEIGSDVWVGGGAIICPGVRIGSRSIIGAGSVVTRDIGEGVFAAGNPCRVIRQATAV